MADEFENQWFVLASRPAEEQTPTTTERFLEREARGTGRCIGATGEGLEAAESWAQHSLAQTDAAVEARTWQREDREGACPAVSTLGYWQVCSCYCQGDISRSDLGQIGAKEYRPRLQKLLKSCRCLSLAKQLADKKQAVQSRKQAASIVVPTEQQTIAAAAK